MNCEIKDLNGFGDGVGRLPDGKVVFVPCTLPGDVVELGDIRHEKRFARAVCAGVLQPSVDRVPAFCQHFGLCGACRLQCAADDSYERLKLKVFAGLTRSLLGEFPLSGLHRGEKTMAYRNRASFRLHPDTAELCYTDLKGELFAVRQCSILEKSVQTVLPELSAFFARNKNCKILPPGRISRIMVESVAEKQKPVLGLIFSEKFSGSLSAKKVLQALFSDLSSLFSGIFTAYDVEGSFADCEWLQTPEATLNCGNGCFPVTYRPGVFLQTNSEIADLIRQQIGRWARYYSPAVVWDLYCGCGQILMSLSEQLKEGRGFESDFNAVCAANESAEKAGLSDRFAFLAGSIPEVIRKNALSRPVADLWTVNPPRSGLGKIFFRTLSKILPKVLFYVSCNPLSMEKDLQEFSALGYELSECELYDMFPWTPHFETLVCLVRKS
jgi:23S rRNA (uracil1939-C5)-methyltransferase